MAVAVTEATFDRDVVELSGKTPVVVDFWAEWCGPCKALSPALEAAEASRGGRVLLAKVDVDTNKALGARYGVQGIPAVKAFRDGKVVSEFTGAVPPAKVEAFFDALLPSKADELLEKGDELSLREAAELDPRRADVAAALGRARLERGAEDEALAAVDSHPEDFAAQGIAARIRLTRAGIGTDAFAALDRGEREAALDSLLGEVARVGASTAGRQPGSEHGAGPGVEGPDPEDVCDLLRRAIVGILSDLDPADPSARDYRRKLAAALG
jgi:putative thioredoxin